MVEEEEKEIKESKKLFNEAKEFLERHRDFFEAFTTAIGIGFEVTPNEVSHFSPEEKKVRVSYKLFEKERKGIRALASAFHELGHVRHMYTDPSTFLKSYEAMKINPALFALYEVCDHTEIEHYLRKFKPIREERERKYEEELGKYDPSNIPFSQQFLASIAYKAMFPDKELRVHEEVKKEFNALTTYKGVNIIDLMKEVSATRERHRLIEEIVRPAYERLLEKDRKAGIENLEQHLFAFVTQFHHGREHKGFELPLHIPKSELQKFASFKKGSKELALEHTARQHGVEISSMKKYADEYGKIEQYIDPLVKEFENIIAKKILFKLGISRVSKRGILIEPGLLPTAIAAIKTGQIPIVFRRLQKTKEKIQVVPSEINLAIVADMSGSMKEGNKEYYQRLANLLTIEAIHRMNEKVKETESEIKEKLDLAIRMMIRRFGEVDTQLKSFEEELSIKKKIDIHSSLQNANEGSTKDALSLKKIYEQVSGLPQKELDKIKSGEKPYIVMVFSDGKSHTEEETKTYLKRLRALGVEVWGFGITKKAEGMLKLYKPHARLIETPAEHVDAIGTFIKERLARL